MREDRERGVIAHRADRLLAVFQHRRQHQFDVFERQPRGGLTAGDFFAFGKQPRLGAFQLGVEVDNMFEPLAVRVLRGECVDDLVMAEELALLRVDRDHLPSAQAPAFDDVSVLERGHAGFRARDQQAVVGERIAQRSETVPVHADGRPTPVEHGKCSRPVPRLHHRVAIGVERLVFGAHSLRFRPRFGHQQRLRHRRVAAGAHQHFEDIIECCRIRAARLDHRFDGAVGGPERIAGHANFVALHPVHIALQRVDLAIVAEHAEGLGETPGGEGVGGITLVIERYRRGEFLVAQVWVEDIDLLGQEHALVHQRARAQRADVKLHDVGRERPVLDFAPADEEVALDGFMIAFAWIVE